MDEFTRIREHARRLAQTLDDIELPDDERIRDLHGQAREAAAALAKVAADPISIGVVGEFSSGKSLLIGAMVGKPDMLPVELRATTGNVTALHLVPGADGNVTQIGESAEIDYMNQADLGECFGYMLGRLTDKVQETLGEERAAEVREYDPSTEGWDRWQRWSETVIWAADQRNASLRKMDAELCRLRAAADAGSELFGSSIQLHGAQVRAALDLGEQTAAPDSRPATRLAGPLTKAGVIGSPVRLRESFPLIRRVHRWVHVAPTIWPLGALQDEQEIVLLDFPGLGSASSGERDDYLCSSELEHITTILILHRANVVGSKRPLEFYDMLQRRGRDKEELADCILVAANAFDLVAPPPLDELPASAAALIAASQELNGIDVTARDLTHGRQDRSAIVSAVAAIEHYRFSYPDTTPESRQQIDDAVLASRGKRKLWQPVVDQLTTSDPKHPYTRMLTAYVGDGGLDSLRDLIERHVHDHGVRIKRKQIADRDATARAAVRKLNAALGDLPAEAARARLAGLVTQIMAAWRHLGKETEEISSPTAVELPGEGGLLEAVRRSAIIEVFQWRYWATLAAAVRDENRVVRSVPPAQKPRVIFKTQESADITDTRGLVEAFAASVEKLTVAWRGRLLDWTDAWAAGIQDHAEVAEARRALTDEDASDLLRDVLDVQGYGSLTSDEVLANLEAMVRFDWVRDAIEDGLIDSQWRSDDASARCPLRPGKALPWHHDVPDDPDGRVNRHQSQIFLLRRELAEAVSDVVTARVSRLLDDCVTAIRVNLEGLGTSIPQVGDLNRAGPRTADGPPPPGSGEGRVTLSDLLDQWGDL
jgi:hypothetical protein